MHPFALVIAAQLYVVLVLGQNLNSRSCSGTTAIAQAYTPQSAFCPTNFTLVRNASEINANGTTTQSLSADEAAYIASRESGPIPPAWEAYLANVLNVSDNANISSSLPTYVSSILNGSVGTYPRLGIANSGGGYRAASYGAGVLNALDGRNESSVAIGTGGLLQAASYHAGLSGGAWLLTSAMQAGLPTMQEVAFGILNASSNPEGFGGWNAQMDIVAPSIDIAEDIIYYDDIFQEISGKFDAGFPLTITDAWARLLARHFLNGTFSSNFFDECDSMHGAGELWSGITNMSFFQTFDVPFPIVVADSIATHQNNSAVISGDIEPLPNLIYEINPFEMGSYDPMLASFTPTQYLGTTNETLCVMGYDQIAFVAGTSSSLFNSFNITGDIEGLLNSTIGTVLERLNSSFPQPHGVELDAASYPNPFQGVSPSTFPDTNQTRLTLVDGGENGENVPFQPLLVQARDVDTIIAIDGSKDTSDNFAAGLAMIATQERTALFPETYAFPAVPNNTNTFTSQNLSSRPTFFGCNESSPVPLVIYIANGAPARGKPAITNTDTLQLKYSHEELQAILDQSFDIATQGMAPSDNSTAKDPAWAACLACAVVDRTRAQLGTEERSGLCQTCFDRYCWASSS